MALGVTQVSPLDANAGFSQNVSLSLGGAGANNAFGVDPLVQAAQTSGAAGAADDTPNYQIIALALAVAGYFVLFK